MTLVQETTFICKHCNEQTPISKKIIYKNDFFCCNGCKTVFSLLKLKGLTNFYDIRSKEDFKASPINSKESSFNYMDSEDFAKSFVQTNKSNKSVTFYLEGIHCMACIWLIEKTPSFIENLIDARLNITDSTAVFIVNCDYPISELAHEISSIGYIPHPISSNEEIKDQQRKEERSDILRIGVAGAAVGNIMIYAVSNYAGADGSYRSLFNWLCFAFSIPVVFYSALPFYRSSYQAIKQRAISIDIPLSLAILIGFLFSTITIFTGSDHNYFDSIAALVFLILISRYFVKKATQQGLNNKGLNTLFTNASVLREDGLAFNEVHSNQVMIGDRLKIRSLEKVIFDGLLIDESALLDNSIVTGESIAIKYKKDELIHAGSINIGNEFNFLVTATGEETKLGKIIKSITSDNVSKNKVVEATDRISKYFLWSVSLITTVTFIYSLYAYGLNPAIERSLAIIIISCPCALALATPLAYVKSLNLLKENGIYIKDQNVLERINNTKNIFLDKTGTLTAGKFEVISFSNLSTLSDIKIHSIVNSLEHYSSHPIANSFKSYFKNLIDVNSTHLNGEIINIPGHGLSVKNQDLDIYLGKLKDKDLAQHNSSYSQVGLYIDSKLSAIYTIGDEIKASSQNFIQKLKESNKEIFIASGDNQNVVSKVAREFGLKAQNAKGNLTPEDKAQLISRYTNSIMLGDGINDVLAFKKADVSIAVSGCADLSLRACDIYSTNQDLKQIYNLIIISEETYKLVKRNMIFSITYNLFGVTLATLGYITPLVAAVFMPLSSLTVLASSFLGTSRLRSLGELQ